MTRNIESRNLALTYPLFKQYTGRLRWNIKMLDDIGEAHPLVHYQVLFEIGQHQALVTTSLVDPRLAHIP
jgi:hypothetical protein